MPGDWAAYRRRWEATTAPGWDAVAARGVPGPLQPIGAMHEQLGFDVERRCWEALVALRCAPWFARCARCVIISFHFILFNLILFTFIYFTLL